MSNVQLSQVRLFCLAWHSIALAQYCYAAYFDNYFMEIPKNVEKLEILSTYGGRYKFLTYWNLVSR